jgi:ribosomal-protein-alanine N-acetyltransferase
MTLSDVGQVMEIERASFSAPWSPRAYRYELTENEHSTMLVVRAALDSKDRARRLKRFLGMVKSEPVLGYGGFWLLVDQAHICTIAVHPEWRRRGLAELLLISLLDRGVQRGALSATLEVRLSNLAAQGLYRKYLFMVVSRRKRYYADNNEDALIMTTPRLDSPEFQSNLALRRRQLLARLQAAGSSVAMGLGVGATSARTENWRNPST